MLKFPSKSIRILIQFLVGRHSKEEWFKICNNPITPKTRGLVANALACASRTRITNSDIQLQRQKIRQSVSSRRTGRVICGNQQKFRVAVHLHLHSLSLLNPPPPMVTHVCQFITVESSSFYGWRTMMPQDPP